ncbi:MAG: AgmX/PglI C-terminal domain-containing protein [Alcanivoracaceae bacterium]
MSENNKSALTILVDGLLPWDNLPGERRRQWIILAILALLCLLIIIIIESTQIPKKDRRDAEEIPERLARLVMEKKKEDPPPPPPVVEAEKAPEPEPEQPKPEVPKPEATPERVEQAREVARKELKVFEESLAGLSDLAPVVRNQPLRTGGGESAQVDRNLITSRAGSGSGGIAVSSVSSGGGTGGSLEGAQVAQVESGIAAAAEAATTVRKTADGKSVRTEEQIRSTFTRSQGRINSAYQRALRQNPALRGTIVLTMTIAPSGEVTNVVVKSSEVGDADLERRIIVIVQSMDFGALPVEVWTGDYALNLFPS